MKINIIAEGNNGQSRLRHYVGAPKRFLRRARDFYVEALVNVDNKVSSANVFPCPTTHVSQLPNNFPGHADSNDRKLKELRRSVSDKYSLGSCNKEFDRYEAGQGCRGMNRSYSVAVGRMGRIDEDEPCEFHESVTVKSRSHDVLTGN